MENRIIRNNIKAIKMNTKYLICDERHNRFFFDYNTRRYKVYSKDDHTSSIISMVAGGDWFMADGNLYFKQDYSIGNYDVRELFLNEEEALEAELFCKEDEEAQKTWDEFISSWILEIKLLTEEI